MWAMSGSDLGQNSPNIWTTPLLFEISKDSGVCKDPKKIKVYHVFTQRAFTLKFSIVIIP